MNRAPVFVAHCGGSGSHAGHNEGIARNFAPNSQEVSSDRPRSTTAGDFETSENATKAAYGGLRR